LTQQPIQFFAPQLAYAGTVASTTYDLSKNLLYSVYSASGTCYIRTQATSTTAGQTQALLPNTVIHIRAKNYATPFVNLSGCVGSYVQVQ
jgi:hypothetical protein